MIDLKNLIKISGNNYASVAEDGIEGNDVTTYVDTGSYALNALVSGSIYQGLPGNKITALAGESSSGKSYLALSMVKTFLQQNPKGQVLYWDSESAITSDMIKTRGIDSKRIVVFGVDTLEAFRNQILAILNHIEKQDAKERHPMLFVLDSLGMLSSEKEMADVGEGKSTADMTKAKIAKSIFRVVTLKLGKLNIPMVVTGHTYSQIGTMYPTSVLAGGTALQYAASSIIFLSKSKDKEDGEVVGANLLCTLKKGRFAVENKQIRVLLNYETGLNKYFGLSEFALKQGVFKESGNKIELPDGTKVFESQLKKDPEKYYTKKILDLIDEAAGREFKYGSQKEELVNEDTGEVSNP